MKKMVNFRIFAERGASILAGPWNVWTAPVQLDPLMRPGRILAECAASHLRPRANVVLSNNQFINTNLSHVQAANFGTANLSGSVVVTQAHNVYIAKNSTQGATTGPVSIDTKSTDGIRH
jgi:hypothetical protein